MEKHEHEEHEKPKRKRLLEHRITHADDGTAVHHHTYQGHDGRREPERQHVATTTTPEETGQHVADMMAQNEQAAPPPDPGAMQEPQAPGGPDATAALGG